MSMCCLRCDLGAEVMGIVFLLSRDNMAQRFILYMCVSTYLQYHGKFDLSRQSVPNPFIVSLHAHVEKYGHFVHPRLKHLAVPMLP